MLDVPSMPREAFDIVRRALEVGEATEALIAFDGIASSFAILATLAKCEEAARQHPEATRDEAVAVCHGVLWLDNNMHNYGTDAWREYFKACVRDARRVVGYKPEELA